MFMCYQYAAPKLQISIHTSHIYAHLINEQIQITFDQYTHPNTYIIYMFMCYQNAPPKLKTSKHTSHTRTGLAKLYLTIGMSLPEHFAHTNLPQWRLKCIKYSIIQYLKQKEISELYNSKSEFF